MLSRRLPQDTYLTLQRALLHHHAIILRVFPMMLRTDVVLTAENDIDHFYIAPFFNSF